MGLKLFQKSNEDKVKVEQKEGRPRELITLAVSIQEIEFLKQQAVTECNSRNGIVRKAIKMYMNSIKKD